MNFRFLSLCPSKDTAEAPVIRTIKTPCPVSVNADDANLTRIALYQVTDILLAVLITDSEAA